MRRGVQVEPVLPLNCGSPSALAPQRRDWDVLLTAETHNFPCAVAPYPGLHALMCLSHSASARPAFPGSLLCFGQPLTAISTGWLSSGQKMQGVIYERMRSPGMLC